MIDLYNTVKSPVLALQKVPRNEIHRYGVIDGSEERDNIYRINNLIEKPSPEEAPSDLAIIGRYILTPDIFDVLEESRPGKGGELQLTDAIKNLLMKRPVYGYLFTGKRYDAGDKLGYLKATVDLALKNPDLAEQFKSYILELSKSLKH
jgi:UTP--glucose-1-phosphate uridylyltransferase